MIRHGAGQDVKARLQQSRPFLIDIALAITDFGHHLRPGQNRLRGLCRAEPPLRFLLGQRPGPVVNAHPAIACPYPARGQAQNAARFGINAQHSVEQNTASRPLADLAQAATALPGRREIEFAAVLYRQNMSARAALRKLRPQPLIRASTVTRGLAKKRENPTIPLRRPPASRRRQVLVRATIPASSSPPFLPGARLRNRPAPSFPKSSPAALHSR